MFVNHLTPLQLKAKLDANEDFILLDVREIVEYEYTRIEGSILIPLNEIPGRIGELDVNKEIVAICHHGIRSMMAADYLVKAGCKKVSNLTGGIHAWSLECDPSVTRY